MVDSTGSLLALRDNGMKDNRSDRNQAPSLTRPPFSTIDELFNVLRREIETARQSLIPECNTIDLSLGIDAVLPLVQPGVGIYATGGTHELPQNFKKDYADLAYGESHHNTPPHVPHATVKALIDEDDERARSIAQRAASRGIIQGIEALDAFKYSFNNAWAANGSEGQRFAFICQDSLQNKDRHVNGYHKTRKNLRGYPSRGPRKQTYDCKGCISVKFSSSKATCDISYRHNAIHGIAIGRNGLTPHQEPSPVSADGKTTEVLNFDQPVSDVKRAEPAPRSPPSPKPRKRKRQIKQPSSPDTDRPLSLAELLQQAAGQSRTSRIRPANGSSSTPDVYSYDLPPWQQPLISEQPSPPRVTCWRPIDNSLALPVNSTRHRLRWGEETNPSTAIGGTFITLKQVKPERDQHLTSHDFEKK